MERLEVNDKDTTRHTYSPKLHERDNIFQVKLLRLPQVPANVSGEQAVDDWISCRVERR